MADRTADCVLVLDGRVRYDWHEFVGVVFVGSPERAEFHSCRFENCDLSGVTRTTIVSSIFKECALPPLR